MSRGAGHGDANVGSSRQKRNLSPAPGDHSSTKRRQGPVTDSVQQSCGKTFLCPAFLIPLSLYCSLWTLSFDTQPLEIADLQDSSAHGGQISHGTSSSSSGTGVFTVSVRDCRNKDRGPLACAEDMLVDMAQTLAGAIEHITRFVDMATSSSGDTRVPPLVFTRLGRGGKSTFLWCLFRTLKAKGFSPIHITLNGVFS